MSIFGHVKPGAKLAPPEGRSPDPLDSLVEQMIESLPMHVRMYPDLYVWALVDMVRECLESDRD